MRRTLLPLALAAALTAAAPAGASTFLNRSLGEWVKDLKSDRADRRRSAAFALGRMGGTAAAAVTDLVAVLKSDRDGAVRDMAASAIGDIVAEIDMYRPEPQWDAAGAALLAALADADARVRRSAAYALGAFGPLAGAAAPRLREALKDREASVRQNAAWAIGRLGRDVGEAAIADLCDRLSDANLLVKRDAASALGALGRAGGRDALRAAAEPLFDLVKARDEDAVVRKAGLDALALIAGPAHQKHAPELYPLLDSQDAELARGAAYALGSMGGEPARKALPALRKALADPSDSVKALAAATLANAGGEAVPAVADLAAALRTCQEPAVRRNCAIALAHIGEAAREAVPALVEAMRPAKGVSADVARSRPYEEVRQQAAEAIAKVRYPGNRAALGAIREHIKSDRNVAIRHHCVWALFGLRDKDKLAEYDLKDSLVKVLEETSTETRELRYDTARLLASLLRDEAPDRVVTTLLDMLAKKDLRLFLGTQAAIDGTGNEAGGGKSSAAARQGGDARYLAAEALGWLGRKGGDNIKVVVALREAARDADPKLKAAAARALEELGKKED